jgi:hypothetical protein
MIPHHQLITTTNDEQELEEKIVKLEKEIEELKARQPFGINYPLTPCLLPHYPPTPPQYPYYPTVIC